jgi:hypothetical protein
MKSAKVINLFSGQGCGKSVLMARLFAEPKILGYGVVMAPGFAKEKVWGFTRTLKKDLDRI